MSHEDLSDGPEVLNADGLHFHECPTCHHTWGCTSVVCVRIHAPHLLNPISDKPSPNERILTPCRAHQPGRKRKV